MTGVRRRGMRKPSMPTSNRRIALALGGAVGLVCLVALSARAAPIAKEPTVPPTEPNVQDAQDAVVFAMACDQDAQWMRDIAVETARQYGASLPPEEYRVLMETVDEMFQPSQLLVLCETQVHEQISAADTLTFHSQVMQSREWMEVVRRWRHVLSPAERRWAMHEGKRLSERREDPRRVELLNLLAGEWGVVATEARLRVTAAQTVAMAINALRPVEQQLSWNAIVAHYTKRIKSVQEQVKPMATMQLLRWAEGWANQGIQEVYGGSKEGVLGAMLRRRADVWRVVGEQLGAEIGSVCVRRWREYEYRQAGYALTPANAGAKKTEKKSRRSENRKPSTRPRGSATDERSPAQPKDTKPTTPLMNPAWMKPAFGNVPTPPPVKAPSSAK